MGSEAEGGQVWFAYKSGDPRYLIDSITHKRGATVLATIGYPTRDNMGDPESMTDWTGTWIYDYDGNNRLSLATPPVPVPDQPAGGIYGYDWVGNRLNPPADPNRMVYNKADELLTWPGMHTYTYYKDGSLNEEKDASGIVTQRSYTYTDDGLLEYAYDGNNNVIGNFTWDADKNRVGMVMGGGTYSFVYDRTAGIPAVVEEKKEGESAVYYFREPGGGLIASLVGIGGWCYYHFDGLGSTRLLTNSSGIATDSYSYDSYGRLLSHTGPDAGDGLAMVDNNPYQYVGRLGYYTHWQDAQLGLLQLGVRFYDSRISRLTQRDPLGDPPFADYAYAHDSPARYADPSGAIWCEWVRAGKSWRIQCHFGTKPEDKPCAWTPPIDKIKKPDWMQKLIEVLDLAADTGTVMDKGRICEKASNSIAGDPQYPKDPLYDVVVSYCRSKGIRNCDSNSDAFKIQCTNMISCLEKTLKGWISIWENCWKNACKKR